MTSELNKKKMGGSRKYIILEPGTIKEFHVYYRKTYLFALF